jgi:phosphopantothenoylcysteine decarboxylase/phosphopantothenate--cysteine ligase
VQCIVTAGPTYEPLDEVRRLTNFSTGKLGTLLARHLVDAGHEVLLLRGYYATFSEAVAGARVDVFTTTDDLRQRLEKNSGHGYRAIFHAAAVSDFGFGKIYEKYPDGSLQPINAGKVSTRGNPLLAELLPTQKILLQLRRWYPDAFIAGWKYEVDGQRHDVVEKARRQVADCTINLSVANGPAYGSGFGIVSGTDIEHVATDLDLFSRLDALLRRR